MKDKLLPTPKDLTLDEIQNRFADDAKARAYLEAIRWPNGVVCPHCKQNDQKAFWVIEENKEKKVRGGLRQCVPCGKQFTCTVGTIFEDSHIPLRKWLVAWYLLCASKKGISALQIQRMLGLGSYRTAWMMMHKIRHALQEPSFSEKLSGTVEADETMIGGFVHGKSWAVSRENKTIVVSLVERGGRVRSQIVDRVTGKNLKKIVMDNVEAGSQLMTDEHKGYAWLHHVYDHRVVKHLAEEYVRKEKDAVVTTNTVEGFFSLLKRGVVGTFHHVSRKHLPLYLAEFDHRYSNRKVSDGERTVASLALAEGKRLTYKPLSAKKA
ncbi:MAG TPA: IS1595 family transposase [Candidatus Methylacidiphilales bacterium]|nr:IS1595 family transposase [Candidatus Methylacidiphilales bacterium]